MHQYPAIAKPLAVGRNFLKPIIWSCRMNKEIFLLLLIVVFSFANRSAYGQKRRYSNQCELIKDLLDSANLLFIHLDNSTLDSSVSILDVRNLFIKCKIERINGGKFKLLRSNDSITLSEIYKCRKNDQDFYCITKEYIHEKIYFSVTHPKSNYSLFWCFLQYANDKRFYFLKKNFNQF